ncbi:MAG: MaoC family dehydratase [Candidatus Nanopelagicales bacterium]
MDSSARTVTLAELSIGSSDSLTKTVSAEDVAMFAQATGDNNRVHTDADYAAGTMFGQVIAHGMLGAGLISAVLGMRLPGTGTIYLGQDLRFSAPILIGDTLTATVTITELTPKRKFTIATLATEVTNQRGESVVSGTAQVIPPTE